MARPDKRRSQNAKGSFYVDATCIDCDSCRWMAPEIFVRLGGKSAIACQPDNAEDTVAALRALVSCPVSAIGAEGLDKEIGTVARSFPIEVVPGEIYHCGYHSPSSYGAASYLVRLPDGNILVDSPRFSKELVEGIRALGGVRYMFLTHRDDVAAHEQYREALGCDRILHSNDVSSSTAGVEWKASGRSPFSLFPGSRSAVAIPTPGHTAGHMVLWVKQHYLFSGDQLTFLGELEHLAAFRKLCWHSWSDQIESQRQLLEYPFEWVFPAHGRRFNAPKQLMREELVRCVEWMEAHA